MGLLPTTMALDIIQAMHDYQKKHGIVNKCITNTQYALDCFRANHPTIPVKACAVIMVSQVDDAVKIWGGHLVLVVGKDTVIDPSYDTSSIPDSHYFTSIPLVLEMLPMLRDDKELLRKTIKAYVDFKGYADQMNAGALLTTDMNYYNAQADAVEAIFRRS